jgi:hypothetical protein
MSQGMLTFQTLGPHELQMYACDLRVAVQVLCLRVGHQHVAEVQALRRGPAQLPLSHMPCRKGGGGSGRCCCL